MADGYEAFDVKQLYAMVDAARQGLTPSRTQVAAWRRANQMLDQHAAALRRHRDQLAMRWPPESNAASAAYLAELDRLLLAVEQTSRASRANAAQIGHVADAIEQAHTTLKPVYDEYVSNETKLARYEATVQAAGAGGRTTHGPVGEALAEGATKLFTSPPVDDGRQAALVRQAREAMAPLTGAAQDATWHMQPPPEYVPPSIYSPRHGGTHLSDDATGGAPRPPVIAPPSQAMTPPESGFGTGRADGSLRIPEAVPDAGTPTEGRPPATNPVVDGGEPVLSGVAPPTVPAPPALTPATGPVAGIGIGGVPMDVIRPVGGMGDAGVPLRPIGVTGGGPMASTPGPGQPPTGSIIGGQPGRTSVRADGGVQRVNPVGGVIGPPAAAAGRGGAARSGVAGTGNVPGADRGRFRSRDAPQRDPEDPWDVEHGVAPVIEPDRTMGPHDPGRGVIGIDR